MKFKLATFLIGAALGVSALTGCTRSNVNSSSNGGAESNPASQGSDPASQGSNPSSSIPEENPPIEGAYEGDTTRQVGKIQNTPVTDYSDATKAKIREFVETMGGGSFNQQAYDYSVKLMLKFKVGDELAVAFCDFMISAQEMGSAAFQEEGFAEKVTNYYYDALKLLNSVDFQYLPDFLTELNAIYKESRDDEFDRYTYKTILEYYNPDVNGFYYRDFKNLKEKAAVLNNADLNSAVSSYETEFNKIEFLDSQKQAFASYYAEEQDYYGAELIPTEFIEFIKKHGSETQTALVSKMKLIVDAASSCLKLIPDLYKTIEERSGSSRNELSLHFKESYYTRWCYEDAKYDNVETARQFARKVLENREILTGLIKAICYDEKFGDLLLDACLDFIVPYLKNHIMPSELDSEKLTAFENKLKALNGKHIKAIAGLALTLIEQVESDDIAEMIAKSFRNDDEDPFDFNAFGNKYIAKLDAILASVSAEEKAFMNEAASVFGVDIFAQIQEFSRIFKAKDLSTETGKQAYYEALEEWAEQFGEKVYGQLDFVKGEDGNKTKVDSEFSINFNSSYIVGQTIDSDDLYIYFFPSHAYDEYGFNNGFGASAAEWNNRVEEFRQLYEEYKDLEGYENEAAQYLAYSQLTMSNFQMSIVDSSKAGYKVVNYSFKIKDKTISGSSTVYFSPRVTFTSLERMYGSNTTTVRFNSYSNYRVYLQNENVTIQTDIYEWVPDSEYPEEKTNYRNKTFTLNTAKAGWNVLTYKDTEDNKLYYNIYYVVTESQLASLQTQYNEHMGILVEGDLDFSSYPYVERRYKVDGVEFYESKNLRMAQVTAGNVQVNKVNNVTVDGMTFKFVVLPLNSRQFSSYDFYIDVDNIADLNSETTRECRLYAYYKYSATINGQTYSVMRSDAVQNVNVTNFGYANGYVTFTYNNTAFKFKAGVFN